MSAARGRGYTLADMTAGRVLGDHARLAGPFVSAEAFLAMLYQEVAAGGEEGRRVEVDASLGAAGRRDCLRL